MKASPDSPGANPSHIGRATASPRSSCAARPVNALDVAGWHRARATLVRALGERAATCASSSSRAEGKGFNAGVDIKEMQRAAAGHEALLGANRGCFAAFAAVYECEVPVIAAVHGYCLGGGIGLVGNADIIVASTDATLRPARGRPRRARRGDAPRAPRPAAQDAGDGLHGARATAAELQPSAPSSRSWSATSCAPPRVDVARRDRGQEPRRDPRGQAVPQRHRPGGREAELPLRAGVHVRAEPRAASRTRRAARSSRSATPSPSKVKAATMADKRITDDDVVAAARATG